MSDPALVAKPTPEPAQDAKPDKPKRTRNRSGSRPKGKPSLEAPLRSLFTTAGELWSLSDDVCGPALVDVAPRFAKAIDTAAKDSPETYEFWAKVVGQGSTVGVLVTLMPLLQVVTLHHVVPFAARVRERREARLAEVPEYAPDVAGPEPEPVPVPDVIEGEPEADNPFVLVNPAEYAGDE